MLQYGSGVLPDYKAPARQRTFQCCLSTLGPYDDPVCILITLYHIKTHSRNRTCHLVQQGYTNKSMAIDLSMFLYDNLCKDCCLMHMISYNCCAPNQSHPVYMFESCITQPNLPNQSVSDDYHIETLSIFVQSWH
jgi:hypothetical protein